MHLSTFIVQQVDSIVDEWEQFAKTLTPAADAMGRVALRDHAKSILLAAARDMETAQSVSEQTAKSKGDSQDSSSSLDVAAASHGELRHTAGFDLMQMTSEFRHLRACVIRRWVASLASPELGHFQEMIRFNEAIDEALTESTAAYAEQVNRSRDIFLAILGHDLRAPLQAVSMSTEMLVRKNRLDADGLVYIASIKRGTRHMGSMISDLLEFVRSRLGSSLPIDPAPMDLSSAAKAVINEAWAGQPDCLPLLKVEGDVHGMWDRGRIEQLLQNLIGNALQHGASHRPLTLTLAGGADKVSLTMHNFGTPIPPEAVATLFDPLVRGASEEIGQPGTATSLGLGLFIAKEVVIAHQGTIEVSSSAEDGTCFTVVLPRISRA
ncbi:HAMP domain-containing histidine kinase [Pseudomonas gingeri]|uniref:histidine kinase n=1 Tax=Pseudomonas gingeri TaxID=117681 RepID=A0A7Y7XJA2_9PSED|nr:HAMP domain-containing sensor histidine kinase [Pseudomonas gingeri]NWA25315.1 HAMP domain-containing histidine kinase [Pseudomonas gingeri]NWB99852.1 HAMP domain-containing histidine kinase [Pseudomonas gingeri]NWD75024.1 HAMP domain-containing histidine kinase [Pseudomonas gingeri]